MEKQPKFEGGIPYNWFTGVGYKSSGIMVVTPNENFYGSATSKCYKHWGNFTNYAGNPISRDDPPERIDRDTKQVTEAIEFILEATGVHPAQVLALSLRLTQEYKGKFQAPFPLHLLTLRK